LAKLQGYDSVILADVAAAVVTKGTRVVSFSDEQVRMLVRNTEQMGCGLVMIGGDNSFGAGGWANSDLEKSGTRSIFKSRIPRSRPLARCGDDDARVRNGGRQSLAKESRRGIHQGDGAARLRRLHPLGTISAAKNLGCGVGRMDWFAWVLSKI